MRGIHRWPLNAPHKGPVTRKMFPYDDVITLADDGLAACVFISMYDIHLSKSMVSFPEKVSRMQNQQHINYIYLYTKPLKTCIQRVKYEVPRSQILLMCIPKLKFVWERHLLEIVLIWQFWRLAENIIQNHRSLICLVHRGQSAKLTAFNLFLINRWILSRMRSI